MDTEIDYRGIADWYVANTTRCKGIVCSECDQYKRCLSMRLMHHYSTLGERFPLLNRHALLADIDRLHVKVAEHLPAALMAKTMLGESTK